MATIKTEFRKQDLSALQSELIAAGINVISLTRSESVLIVETAAELTTQQKATIETKTNLKEVSKVTEGA